MKFSHFHQGGGGGGVHLHVLERDVYYREKFILFLHEDFCLEDNFILH